MATSTKLFRFLILSVVSIAFVPAVLANPDLAILNANVYLADGKRAEAFAVGDGMILAIGRSNDISAMAGPATQLMDLNGATVVPGFNDAHIHPRTRFSEDSIHGTIDATGFEAIAALVQRFQRKAAKLPANTWIIGLGYQDTRLGRHLNRYDLDEISTEHPIFVAHASFHLAAVNSLALDLAGLDAQSSPPPGGEYVRNADGDLTGLLKETAAFQFINIDDISPAIPPLLPALSEAERLEAYLAEFREFSSKGITSINHAGASLAQFSLYQKLVEAGMPVRVGVMFEEGSLDDAISAGLKTGHGNDHLSVTAIKIFHGNSLSGRTAWLKEPYAHDPDYYGLPVSRNQQSLNALISKIYRNGFQAAVHANGDREIEMVLDAFETVLGSSPKQDHRFRIEHASVMNQGLLDRALALGVVVAPHSYVYEHGDKMEAYGSFRWDWMHANRSFIEMGITNAGNSDYPVSAADPLLRIQSLVTRRFRDGKQYGKNQTISVPQAISVWTLGSATASFAESRLGTLEPGKLADFVVIERNPSEVELESIKDVRVLATYIDGKEVYRLDTLTGEKSYGF